MKLSGKYIIGVPVGDIRAKYTWGILISWMTEQGIESEYEEGKLYFKSEEHATLFTLKFGI